MGVAGVQQCVTPSLSYSRKKNRVCFILHQISYNCKPTGLASTPSDRRGEWLYHIHEREMVHMLPGEEKVGSMKVQHKSHIPKVMFIPAVSHPNPSHFFVSKFGIWRVCVMKEAQQATVRDMNGEEYEINITADDEWHL
ncbi:unnamed protein product [Choristocarpus tenellus]